MGMLVEPEPEPEPEPGPEPERLSKRRSEPKEIHAKPGAEAGGDARHRRDRSVEHGELLVHLHLGDELLRPHARPEHATAA